MTTFVLSPPPTGRHWLDNSQLGSRSGVSLQTRSTVQFSEADDSYSTTSLLSPTFSLHTELEPYEELESATSLTAIDRSMFSTEQITFTNWVNDRIKPGKATIKAGLHLVALRKVTDLGTDLGDGVVLIKLLENLTKKKIKGYAKNPKLTAHKMVNLDLVFEFLHKEKIKVIGIGSHNIFNGDLKLILGLIWTLVQKYQLRMIGTHVSTKVVMVEWLQALLPSWKISNVTSDWSDGRALIALINEVKPGVASNVTTLDPTKRRGNCLLGLKVAHDHLKIPKLISADDLADSSMDELSMMTYLSYFVEPFKARLLKWVKKQIPHIGVSNFTSDWSDGRALAALTEALYPYLLPEDFGGDIKSEDRVENIQKIFDACERKLGIQPNLKADQLAKARVEELQLMTYILRLKTGQLRALPDEIRVTGEGISKAAILKQTRFQIDTTQAGPGKLSIDAYYNDGEKVKFSFSEVSPAVALISYTPPSSGTIHIDILWSDTPIPNSPFTIKVTDSTLIRFIDFEHHSKLCRVNVPISLSLQARKAGPGTLEAILDYNDGTEIKALVKKQPDSSLTLEYTPTKPGKPALRVFWNCDELRHLSIPYTVVDSGNYRVTKKPIKKIYRTFEGATFSIAAEGASLDVLLMTAFLDDIQIPIRFKKIDGNQGDATFTPTLPGVYRVEVACVNMLVEGSPFQVEVADPSQCRPVGLLPKYLKMGDPYKFTVDMKNSGVGDTEFVSADGGGTMPFDTVVLPVNKNGMQTLEVTPQKSGDYLVGIQFHGSFIPSNPFRVTVCDPNKCRAGGNLKTGVVGKPVEFNVVIMGKESDGIKPTVKAFGPSAKYTADIRSTEEYTFAVRFTPWEVGNHEITIQYGGFDIPKSPFQMIVSAFDSKGISATGSGLQEAFTGLPAQFVVLAKQEGLLEDGNLQIKVAGVVNNVECKVRARDNSNGTYNIAYLAQLPGAYLVTILAGGRHIPGSPFRLTATPGPDALNCYMYGPATEPQSVLTIGKPIDFTVDASEGGTGTLSVKAVGPGGAEARVYMAKAGKKGIWDIMLDPVRHGKYRVSVKWSGKHIQASPFLLKVFPGADASKCKAFGPGLEDGMVGKASSFTIETRNAGAGTLKVRLHGVKDAFKIDIKPADQRDVRTLVARYDPRKPGEYLVTIKWTDLHVPGSPFRVKIEGVELTQDDIDDSMLRATPRHEELDAIPEEEEEEEDVLDPSHHPQQPKKKKGKKKRSKRPRPMVQVVPVMIPMMQPAQHYQRTFQSSSRSTPPPQQASGGTGAGRMMTFNGVSRPSSRRPRPHMQPRQPRQAQYTGQANIQMNTVRAGQARPPQGRHY